MPSDPTSASGALPTDEAGRDPVATPGTKVSDERPRESMQRAQDLAVEHQQRGVRQARQGPPLLLHQLPRLAAALQAAYQAVLRTAADDMAFSYAAEWLLDNFYVVEQALYLIQNDLPVAFYRQLPVLHGDSPDSTYPRVYALAHAFVVHEQGAVEVPQMQRFVLAYQETQPLTMGELWALPLMVRLSLLEQLAQDVRALLQPETAGEPRQTTASGESDMVAAAIASLHRLNTTDWQACFEAISHVEHTLRQDPAQVYAAMDFTTRDHYRKVIEDLARGSAQSELAIAQHAIAMAQSHYEATVPKPLAPALFGTRRYHVGYYLLGSGRHQLEQQIAYHVWGADRWRRWVMAHPTLVYLGGIALGTALLLVSVGVYTAYTLPVGQALLWWVLATVVLTLVPMLTVAVVVVNWLVTHMLPPQVLPKMEFEAGIPATCNTMVVIPCLISHTSDLDSLFQQLELHYLRNPDPALAFALLSDFADAPTPTCPEDETLLAYAQQKLATLHAKYTLQPFYFFHRHRLWNPCEGVWMGWERKRGKLYELNRLLRGAQDTSYSTQLGLPERLATIRYVLTLDADTILPREAARRLVGTLAHPLNQAEFAATSNPPQGPDAFTVSAGYTILQPRTAVQPAIANRSLFTQVFAGDSGFDLYTLAVSDVYQDLFGAGIYVGKGLYDVDAFERSLHGAIPENTLLSHDLCEGIHGRVGLASDIVLYEDYPPHYLVNVRRSHRWIRGDWQLLPWLFRGYRGAQKQRRMALIERWKMLDNLRRSLLPLALLCLLIAAWTVLPGSPLLWTLAGLLVPAQPLITDMLTGLLHMVQQAWRRHRQQRLSAKPGSIEPTYWQAPFLRLRNGAIRSLLFLAFLPYEALLMLEAIATTVVRLSLTRRRLLQWTTAARTVRLFGDEVSAVTTWRVMFPSWLLVVALTLGVSMVRPMALLTAAPFCLAWLFASKIAYLISRPRPQQVYTPNAAERQRLRTLARRTWLFYEQFVGPEDNWLPPDHFQEMPRGVLAQRTSPTNIGLYLLALLAAHDLGYIATSDYVLRLRFTFATLARLERYRGHFLNWIDTHTLTPLPPRYVSTVDSGNLASCLIVLRHGCLALRQQPVWSWELWQGLLDTFALLGETVALQQQAGAALSMVLEEMRQKILAVRTEPAHWYALLTRLVTEDHPLLHRHLLQFVETAELDAEAMRTCRIHAERIDTQLAILQRQVIQTLPWLDPTLSGHVDQAGLPAAGHIPTWAELPALYADLLASLAHSPQAMGLVTHVRRLQQTVIALLADLADLADLAAQYVADMDFSFVFNWQRQTFHIGYNLDSGQLDPNYYDLLASEARLASLVAIAKQDVPQRHWLYLGRPLTQASNGTTALLSWSATMFEYLMPCLLVRHYTHSLLDSSCRAAVEHQIAYGRQLGLPWGISESGFYAFDPAMNYQYRAFGVPGLGLKRGLSEDLVITPYASLLALSFAPQAVLQNMTHLINLGGRGRYGFYEALDFTPGRLQLGQTHAVVRSYMAHHQGMILLALANYLQGDRMIDRMHAAPAMQSVELLLQEKVPVQAPLQFPHEEERYPSSQAVSNFRRLPAVHAWHVPVQTPLPLVHVLANGRLATFITNSGGGYSQFRELALTRWRSDTTLDDWGMWLYVQDHERNVTWSASHQPLAVLADQEEVIFHPHMAEFQRRDHGISLHTVITVAPDDDVEIRRVTLTNNSDTQRTLHLTTYGEVVLAPQAADQRHPAFSKLFVESEPLPSGNGMLFRRRPRDAHEPSYCLVHMLVAPSQETMDGITWESDRARFLGRNRTLRNPLALETALSNTTGATLDPVMALRTVLTLPPQAQVSLAVLTLVADSRSTTLQLAQRYQSWQTIERVFGRARSNAEQELHQLGLHGDVFEHIQSVLSALLYPHHALRAATATLAANSKGQEGLWAYGISGDYPILLVCVDDESAGDLLQSVLQAHMYWRRRGVQIDLLLLNRQETGYGQEMQGFIFRLLRRMESEEWLQQRGGIFVLRNDQLPEADRLLLLSAARVVLYGDRGSLASQLGVLSQTPTPLPPFVPAMEWTATADITPPLPRPHDLLFDNSYGGFSADGREYIIYRPPPAPWCNVIANPHAGFVISDSGGGYTWASNSGENRLSTWRNDPTSDQPAEVIYLRDEETGGFWSATPQPAGAEQSYLTRHGAGYTIFQHHSHNLCQELRLFVAPDAPVKLMHLRLQNVAPRPRRITVTLYVEWVLGVERSITQPYIVSAYDDSSHALFARNAYSAEFGAAVAFVAASRPPHGLTANRAEFLGRFGTLQRPAALQRIGLAGSVEAGSDPCAAFQVHLDLAEDGSEEVVFILGQGADHTAAQALVQRFQDPAQVQQAWQATLQTWDDILGAVQVQTPDPGMNLLLNRWLLYQTLSCRLWGRSALYQSSGAFGFRDQLQDVMALLHTRPDLARAQILEAARHQFDAGDVLHWWHPPTGRGVRTRMSDDLLWLPFVTAHYISTTGDTAILEESVPFLQGAPLRAEEEERYAYYAPTTEHGTLYEHCRRALTRGHTQGCHGLPLIGGGDWNDGMNRVGIAGQGESVWLGWFLLATLKDFAAICDRFGHSEHAQPYRQQADALGQALAMHAWDGAWYRRAWYDDGTPLGSQQNQECQIDAIAQAWAVLSGAGEPRRVQQAMRSVMERLVNRDERLMLLLTPPFDQTRHDPGYIKGYLPGIRENGGQYTHAALWVIWAFAQLGEGNLATDLFHLINPIWRSETATLAERYKVEPYVISADVYGVAPHAGRGGWTWYTGSAGWMYRLGVEALLGVQRQGTTLRLTPCLPREWTQVSLTYRYGATTYHICIDNPQGRERGVPRLTLDGRALPGDMIALQDDGGHHQVVAHLEET